MEGIIHGLGPHPRGYKPSLSIEITRECPLRCPGCYAYGDDHLGGDVTLRAGPRLQGPGARSTASSRSSIEHKPLHVSIVGGEPLVRYRELNDDPAAARRARHLHAARHERRAADSDRVGAASAGCRSSSRSTACSPSTTSGARRRPTIASSSTSPGTRSRCTARSRGSRCSATATSRSSSQFWSANAGRRGRSGSACTRRRSARCRPSGCTPDDRERVVADLMALRPRYPKLQMPEGLIERLREAAASRPTSASSRRRRRASRPTSSDAITPCQFGGKPDCSNCGCIASAGLGADRAPPAARAASRSARSSSSSLEGRPSSVRRLRAGESHGLML